MIDARVAVVGERVAHAELIEQVAPLFAVCSRCERAGHDGMTAWEGPATAEALMVLIALVAGVDTPCDLRGQSTGLPNTPLCDMILGEGG